jgi:hypothetical protein
MLTACCCCCCRRHILLLLVCLQVRDLQELLEQRTSEKEAEADAHSKTQQ